MSISSRMAIFSPPPKPGFGVKLKLELRAKQYRIASPSKIPGLNDYTY